MSHEVVFVCRRARHFVVPPTIPLYPYSCIDKGDSELGPSSGQLSGMPIINHHPELVMQREDEERPLTLTPPVVSRARRGRLYSALSALNAEDWIGAKTMPS